MRHQNERKPVQRITLIRKKVLYLGAGIIVRTLNRFFHRTSSN